MVDLRILILGRGTGYPQSLQVNARKKAATIPHNTFRFTLCFHIIYLCST
jgi:hypothetical protein